MGKSTFKLSKKRTRKMLMSFGVPRNVANAALDQLRDDIRLVERGSLLLRQGEDGRFERYDPILSYHALKLGCRLKQEYGQYIEVQV